MEENDNEEASFINRVFILLFNTHLRRGFYVADTELGVGTVSNNCPHEVTTLWRKQTVSNAQSLVIPIAMGAHSVGTKV